MGLAQHQPEGSSFRVGDLVRVGVAEMMPIQPRAGWEGTIGGAEGVICEITRDAQANRLMYHVALNRNTIDRMPEEYLRECRERWLLPSVLVLNADQLEHFDWSTTEPRDW